MWLEERPEVSEKAPRGHLVDYSDGGVSPPPTIPIFNLGFISMRWQEELTMKSSPKGGERSLQTRTVSSFLCNEVSAESGPVPANATDQNGESG